MSQALSAPLTATRRLGPGAIAVAGSALLVAVATADGGYFPTASGWIALGLAWALAITLAFRSMLPRWTRTEALLIAAVGVFLSLAGISLSWSAAASLTTVDLQRLLALPLVPILVSTFRVVPSRLLLPVVAAITTIVGYALLTRLLPERFGTFDAVAGYRLSEPLGYWNALGILCAIGVVLALGVITHADKVGLGAVAAVVPLLAVTLYFTFSRGAWIALAFALIVLVVVEPNRLRLLTVSLVTAPFAIAAVLVASTYDALTTRSAELSEATPAGHRFGLWLLLLCGVAGLSGVVWTVAAERVRVSSRARTTSAAVLVLVLLAGAAVGLARFGAPWTIASNAYDSFTSPPPRVQNLNDRLFTFSSNGRIELWDAAWENYKDHPLTGSGAGTFEQYWLENRDVGLKVRDAHSLYLETLSELGPLGLALLLLALGVPVYAAFKARGHPLVPAAFGAYVAYLVHAGVDWDWEMPAVTLTALFIGASIVVAARKPEDEERTMSPRLRYSLLAGTLALAAVAFVGLVGNMALAQSADAARAGDWEESEAKARRAETWAPWSPEPWQRIGESQLARGELADARASFRTAIDHDERDWELWLDLARASAGRAQLDALAQATRLNPLSPELAQLRKELAELGTIEVGG